MNLTKLKQEILADEGRVNKIYLDKYGNPTLGVGHLITKNDVEYGLPVGTKISDERVDYFFNKDIEGVEKDCCKLFKGFESFPEELQLILGNMMFNLGSTRLEEFKKFVKCISNRNYILAVYEMQDSKWFREDVPERAKRLRDRMINFSDIYNPNRVILCNQTNQKHDIT